MRAACAWLLGALGVAIGCGREAQPGASGDQRAEPFASAQSGASSGHSASPSAVAEVRPSPAVASATAYASANRVSDANHPDGANAATEPDPANKARPPLASADLEERASHLLDAVVRNDPSAADDFFFPKAPFIPLKDVGDPARYFDQLLATYHRDIRALHGERKDWTGAEFVSFELGTAPTWVLPGKEYNRIGYFRTFGGKLRYRVGDKSKEIGVSTIISWDGRWYVTHLSPIRH